ncbi:MAG: sulfurase [Porticoccaceae bacterium]
MGEGDPAVSRSPGRLDAIHLASRRGMLPVAVAAARAVAGRGLVGDRYCEGAGTWSRWPGTGRAVTLIAAEVLEQLPASCRISAAESRRNLLTRDVDLDALLGREFRIGGAWFRGQRRCEPCAHLERLTRPGIAARLQGRGGLRADVLRSGWLRVGDAVVVGEFPVPADANQERCNGD